ncbi:hypothetical protein MK851_10100 [Tenacibaculum sp. 1B UA]|uniref:hypothetical protein n=1 Tax=Tenacibaculum sp. 1B UA TaxID=2922252 RepID=UPI002A23B3C3|nr:hypothetical protein [Tenacibaculum sp. 1B UA]MDX8553971.1 hypothetical protein [Tenacibaculum sp. 1B UA]
MNKLLRFLNVLFVTIVYFYAISYIQKNQSFSKVFGSDNSSHEKYIQKLSPKALYRTSESENLSNYFNNLPTTNAKNSFSGFGITLKSIELFFNRKYLQYTLLSRSILINHRKSDLIFPFHYHW